MGNHAASFENTNFLMTLFELRNTKNYKIFAKYAIKYAENTKNCGICPICADFLLIIFAIV